MLRLCDCERTKKNIYIYIYKKKKKRDIKEWGDGDVYVWIYHICGCLEFGGEVCKFYLLLEYLGVLSFCVRCIFGFKVKVKGWMMEKMVYNV